MRIAAHNLPARYQNQIAAQLDRDAAANRKAPAPEPECRVGHGPLATPQVEARNSGKYIIRVTSFRVRLLDEDNLVGKWHVDALRYAGILPSDAPNKAHIVTTQEKVAHRAEERTEIEIDLPE